VRGGRRQATAASLANLHEFGPSDVIMALMTTYSFFNCGEIRRDSEPNTILVLLTVTPNPQLKGDYK